jgi:hypothetical protein
MSRREFNQCLAYLQIEPPELPANTRTASVMAQIANYAGRSLPDKKMLSADDFLGKPQAEPPPQTIEDQKAFLRGLKPEG